MNKIQFDKTLLKDKRPFYIVEDNVSSSFAIQKLNKEIEDANREKKLKVEKLKNTEFTNNYMKNEQKNIIQYLTNK